MHFEQFDYFKTPFILSICDDSRPRFFIGSWTDIRDVVRPVKRALRPLRDPDHDPDHVHRGVHDLLRQEDGLSHVVIVRLNERPLVHTKLDSS